MIMPPSHTAPISPYPAGEECSVSRTKKTSTTSTAPIAAIEAPTMVNSGHSSASERIRKTGCLPPGAAACVPA